MLFGFPFSETHWLELNDDMVRIASANCGSVEAQTFTYDPFGNLNKVGNPGQSFQPIYAMTRNRISTVGSTTAQYDNNGNVLNDGVNTYTWDADGNSITVDTVGATFDALGRMVEQNRSSVYTEIVYAPTGAKLALMSGTTGQTLQNAFINLPGQGHGRLHEQWVGSLQAFRLAGQRAVDFLSIADSSFRHGVRTLWRNLRNLPEPIRLSRSLFHRAEFGHRVGRL